METMTTGAYRDQTWVNPKLEPRRSPIEGRGLYAVEPIREGETIAILGGRIGSDEEVRALEPPYSSAALAENINIIIDDNSIIRFGNHSCDPNAWMIDSITEVSQRLIDRGEEITIDYALHTAMSDWLMHCNCGSSLCRRLITGDDWKRAKLQERYDNHWSPFILERIKRVRASRS